MELSIDGLKQECNYCYRVVDASGLEGFKCTNKTVNKTTSWCRPKNANKPCSTCEYCKPKEEEITIDECIEIWTHPTQYFPSKREEVVDFAIDTMRKYQKIEEIINKWNEGIYDDEGLCHVEVLEMISDEVLEDGKID